MMNKITTLKELKELDAKATSAPWRFSYGGQSIYSQKKKICGMPSKDINYFEDRTNLQNSKLIAATRNALPDLIRVIELAEGALNVCHLKEEWTKKLVLNAIEEIRKLKGE